VAPSDPSLDQLRAYAQTHEELRILDPDGPWQFLVRWRQPRSGRFVPFEEDDARAVLDELLTPGILLSRHLGTVIVVGRTRQGAPALAVLGDAQHVPAMIAQAPGLHFAITSPDGSWTIQRMSSPHLRVEGAVWTVFFPWIHVRRSLALGGVVVVITWLAMWAAYGEFWLPAGGPGTGQTARWVTGFAIAAAAPGALAVFANFLALSKLEPDRHRSPEAWRRLLAITAFAIGVAVALAIVHQPFAQSH